MWPTPLIPLGKWKQEDQRVRPGQVYSKVVPAWVTAKSNGAQALHGFGWVHETGSSLLSSKLRLHTELSFEASLATQ